MDVERFEEIVTDVERELLEEDKMGATREQLVSGTCARIIKRAREE